MEGVGAAALEILSAVRLIRSFSKEAAEKARFGSHVLSAYQVAKRMAVANGAAEGVGILVLKLCLVLSIFYGASLVHHNDISGGILVSYAFIAMQVIMALTVLAPVLADISNALHSANKVVELMQREPAINTKGGLTLPRSDGKLELNNVTLVLPHADVPRLSRVSLQVEAGTHVAVFGPAGSGKTVLLSLLVRFFEPVEGLVLLDDTDISTYEPAWLQSQIGLVAQEPVIFAASVADNMSLGTHASQTQLEQIAVALNLHADILRLPEGYQSNLAGPGVAALLSPWRSRLSTARRLLHATAPLLSLATPAPLAPPLSANSVLSSPTSALSVSMASAFCISRSGPQDSSGHCSVSCSACHSWSASRLSSGSAKSHEEKPWKAARYVFSMSALFAAALLPA